MSPKTTTTAIIIISVIFISYAFLV